MPATSATLFYSWFAADFYMKYANQQSISLDIYEPEWQRHPQAYQNEIRVPHGRVAFWDQGLDAFVAIQEWLELLIWDQIGVNLEISEKKIKN